ncbi:HNH endonuclease [Microbacterium foliorum]|nr:HNH endonuclease [Microbacterium foliorum]
MFRRAEAVIVEAVASDDGGEFAHAVGCRGVHEVVQRAVRVDVRGAGRVDRVVDLVRRPLSLSGERMPARWSELRVALLDGVVGVSGFLAATGPIEKVWDRLSVDQRLAADVALAGCARGHGVVVDGDGDGDGVSDVDPDLDPEDVAGPAPTVQDLAMLAEDLASMFDPDGEEPKDEGACRRRGVTIGRLTDGVHAIRGFLTPDVAGQFQAIMDAILNPKGDGPPMPGVHFTPSDGVGADTGRDIDVYGDSAVGTGVGGVGADADADADSDVEGEDPFNSDPRCVLDGRTSAQKRHDALAMVLTIAARHNDMPSLGGAAPVLVVTVDAADLAAHTTAHLDTTGLAADGSHVAGAAFGNTAQGSSFGNTAQTAGGNDGNGGWATITGSGAHVPVSVAAQIGCSGTIQRVEFDAGRIIAITTTDRVFTVHQRRAIIARDRECLIPGCHVSASWCEIHHVTEHAKGGPTHTDNGVPLCWWHHRSLGKSGWEIRMNDGIPQVRGPAWWDPDQRWRTPRLSAARRRIPSRLARTG